MTTVDTLSPSLGLLLMGDGLHNDDWGSRANDNLSAIDTAIGGVGQISGLTGGTATLSKAQALPSVLVFSGALAAAQTIIVPASAKKWIFDNETSGAFALTVRTANGIGVSVGQGSVVEVYCDGTNVKSLSIPGTPVGVCEEYYGVELPDARYVWANGQLLDRSAYAAGFNALTRTALLTVGGGATVCACTEDLTGKGLIGVAVEGPGVAGGTTVSAVTANSVTLSKATTGGAAQQTLRFFPYGNGDGATTYAVPDRTECVAVGSSVMGGRTSAGRISTTSMASGANLGQRVGEDRHKLVATEMPKHNHDVTDPKHNHGITDPGHDHPVSKAGTGSANAPAGAGNVFDSNYPDSTGNATTGIAIKDAATGITIATAGSDGDHNNLQPTLICNFILRVA